MTKDMVLDAMDAQKEEILLKVFSGLGIQGVVGIDLIRQEKEWK
jgi:D-alanine-D-alanine ligase-like ATP-grasp enzyme